MNGFPIRLLLLLPFLVVLPSPAHAQTTSVEELALRLLDRVGPQPSTLTLVPDGVPADGLEGLVWPADVRLVGSLVRRDPEGAIIEFETVLDSPLTAREAMGTFQQSLLAGGWREWLSPRPLGFAPQPVLYTALYCAPGDSDFLYLSAFQSLAPLTDMRLEFFADVGYSPCLDPEPRADPEPPSIPILLPPSGSDIVNFGSQQVLIDQLSTSALITTELTQAELSRHFEEQLELAGWQRQTRGESGARDYSRWTLSDTRGQVWTSLLSIIEIEEEPGSYFVAVVVLIPAAAK